MKDSECVEFLKWALPRIGMRWAGFRKVRRQVCRKIDRRIHELGFASVSDYIKFLERTSTEWKLVEKAARITISRFFRDKGVYEYLADRVLPRIAKDSSLKGGKEISILSLGCAAGEEPYSLNVLWKLKVGAGFSDLRFSITACDSDERMIERARRASYPFSSVKETPVEFMERIFNKEGKLYVLRNEYKKDVKFIARDARDGPPEGVFRLILCRNLLFTYFEEELQTQIARMLAASLVTGGVFVIGKHESLPDGLMELEPLEKTIGIYIKKAATAEAVAAV